jgi:uncharacterized protein
MPVGIITDSFGNAFDVQNPERGDFNIEDIAHSLAQIARFGGRCKDFYSVAQHSFYVSYMMGPKKAKIGLLHDASEAYLSDIASPIKPLLPDYVALEKSLQGKLALAFDLPVDAFEDPDLKLMDKKIQGMEAANLITNPQTVYAWCGYPDDTMFSIDRNFKPWPWKDAKRMFINRYWEIFNGLHDFTGDA